MTLNAWPASMLLASILKLFYGTPQKCWIFKIEQGKAASSA